MSKILSSFSSSDALKMMKADFPNDYQERIEVGKQLIIHLKKIYNSKDYTAAYQRYVNSGCSNESHIMMLCALQQLNDKVKQETEAYKKSLYGMIEDRDKLLEQQEHNERSIHTNETDRKLLRQYYRSKIDELNQKIDEYSKSIEVVDAVIVHVPNLFSQPISA